MSATTPFSSSMPVAFTLTADVAPAVDRIASVKMMLPRMIRDHLAKLPPRIRAAVERFMGGTSRTPEGEWNATDALRSGTEGLRGALRLGGEGNVYGITTSPTGVRLVYGVDASAFPWMTVHEKGMVIKSKGRMHRYFWARFAETGKEFFRIMALSVRKRGSVRLRGRPWWTPGTIAFRQEAMRTLGPDLRAIVIATWESR